MQVTYIYLDYCIAEKTKGKIILMKERNKRRRRIKRKMRGEEVISWRQWRRKIQRNEAACNLPPSRLPTNKNDMLYVLIYIFGRCRWTNKPTFHFSTRGGTFVDPTNLSSGYVHLSIHNFTFYIKWPLQIQGLCVMSMSCKKQIVRFHH